MTRPKQGRKPLPPGEALTLKLQVPIDGATFKALRKLAWARGREGKSMAAVVREFIAKGLEESARK